MNKKHRLMLIAGILGVLASITMSATAAYIIGERSGFERGREDAYAQQEADAAMEKMRCIRDVQRTATFAVAVRFADPEDPYGLAKLACSRALNTNPNDAPQMKEMSLVQRAAAVLSSLIAQGIDRQADESYDLESAELILQARAAAKEDGYWDELARKE